VEKIIFLIQLKYDIISYSIHIMKYKILKKVILWVIVFYLIGLAEGGA